MNKQIFLSELRTRLSGLPQEDIEERLGFYEEMIDDRMEDGCSEEEAVAGVGSINEIVSQILADYPLSKLVKEKVKPKHKLRAWEIVLLVLGSPIWLCLLIAAFVVIFALYVVLWALIVVLWAVEISLMISVLACVAGAVILTVQGQGLLGLAALGAGIFCAGLSIFLFFGCKGATKGAAILTKKIALGIKSLFIGKGEKNEQNS